MLFADLASEFFVELAFKFGKDFWTEGPIARAANEILESFSWLMPGRSVVVVSDGVFRAAILAGHIVLRTEVFAREDREAIVAIDARLAIKLEWPKVFCIDRWTMNSF